MSKFIELNSNELEVVDGGVVGWVIVGGLTLIGSFAAGYGLAYWLG